MVESATALELAPVTRVVAYARVSTTEQAEQGYSMDAQVDAIRDYCRKEGNSAVVEEYRDAGFSGKSADGRPALQRLLADAKAGMFDEVIVWKLSRMARKLKDLLAIVEELQAANVAFRSLGEKFETATPGGRFQFQILGAAAEYERGTIVDNVRLGCKRRARSGRWVGGIVLGYESALPDGRKADSAAKKGDRVLRVVPEEAAIVRQIFDLYTAGAGCRSIANTLNRAGLHGKKGHAFSVCTVRTIVTNPLYAGYIRYAVRENWSEKRRKGKNPNPIIEKGIHEPIISQEVWDAAERLYKEKSKWPKRVHDTPYTLTGLLKCPVCGSSMVISRTTNRLKDGTKRIRRYYVCGKHRAQGASQCHANSVNADKAEREVYRRIRDAVLSPKVLQDVVARANARNSAEVEPLREELRGIERSLSGLSAKRSKLLDLYAEDRLDKDALMAAVDDVGNKTHDLAARKEEVEARLRQTMSEPISVERVRSMLRRFNELLESSSAERKKLLLHLIVKSITVGDNRDIGSIELVFDEALQSRLLRKGPSADLADGPVVSLDRRRSSETITFRI